MFFVVVAIHFSVCFLSQWKAFPLDTPNQRVWSKNKKNQHGTKSLCGFICIEPWIRPSKCENEQRNRQRRQRVPNKSRGSGATATPQPMKQQTKSKWGKNVQLHSGCEYPTSYRQTQTEKAARPSQLGLTWVVLWLVRRVPQLNVKVDVKDGVAVVVPRDWGGRRYRFG